MKINKEYKKYIKQGQSDPLEAKLFRLIKQNIRHDIERVRERIMRKRKVRK